MVVHWARHSEVGGRGREEGANEVIRGKGAKEARTAEEKEGCMDVCVCVCVCVCRWMEGLRSVLLLHSRRRMTRERDGQGQPGGGGVGGGGRHLRSRGLPGQERE